MVYYAHFWWGRASIIELVRDLRAMNVLTTFQNDPWKFADVRALTVIFHVRSWKMRNKIAVLVIIKKTEHILINIVNPTFVLNLVTLAWNMSSGMPKEAGSLNGQLCACLMRRNPHDQPRPGSYGNKCPCQVWKWSVKNYGRESVNGARLPCRPPARSADDNTPEPLRAAG